LKSGWKIFLFCCALLPGGGVLAQERGVNFAPQRYNSNSGTFMPGGYDYHYSPEIFAAMRAVAATNHWPGFHPRICINAATANQPAELQKIHDYFVRAGERGIICWFETTADTNRTHATGRVPDLNEIVRGWQLIHQQLADLPEVRYEIFNEPFGYTSAENYLKEMTGIIRSAGLPANRCILDGIGYAENVQAVARAGWPGDLAYHFYPNWKPPGEQSADGYFRRIRKDLGGLSRRVFLTEFGANLRIRAGWMQELPADNWRAADVNCLLGLGRALKKFHDEGDGLKGAYLWHGWDNNDGYDFWSPRNQAGAAAEIMVLNSL
jgi:Cellulase (glycosyl hydrolase family 5)